ncbi:hypothetical protein [Actinoplanes regularis]|uniref:Uncharacterized protein n=1 Tax=Actinoplanes regularis TaxID=52697 RepID=A0A239KH15_9ACTN|nr:hypothetical protein [Actinoplanes regularis]GIE92508.1 hypothetical protein Are01nite_89880 [Actinoplanes regularis]SNT17686.1 hypothetical protein SAMN06264365_1523 [Actinoplanes regularis]
MSDIPIDRYGRVLDGENKGYFIRVTLDAEVTHGYYVFLVDDIKNPSDGGDYWAKDVAELANLFRVSEWRIEWL